MFDISRRSLCHYRGFISVLSSLFLVNSPGESESEEKCGVFVCHLTKMDLAQVSVT